MNNPRHIPEDFPIRNILVVDDEKSLRSILHTALDRFGFGCMEAENAETALRLISSHSFDLIISDIAMPGMDGIQLLKRTRSQYPDIDFIIMTGYASDYSYVDIMDAGASDYMTKPFNMNSVLARINRIARERITLIALKKTNQELCQAIERANFLAREADEASKAKTFFLASMSHEIRTPLNGIVGYTDMLMDTRLDQEQKAYLKNAKLSCEALLSVVNDILDFSKVEAGKLSLQEIRFDPEVLCYDAIDLIRSKVDESKVELLCTVSDAVPGHVVGDPHRFRQVLLNLLGNAVKFTQNGFVKLHLDSKPEDDGGVRLILSVEDTGIGIPEDALEKIFNPFIQSEDDITSRSGGTGLGLAISRNIAQKMDGNVWAERRPGKGSVFYYTACFKGADSEAATRVRPGELKGKNVLLCTALSGAQEEIITKEFTLAGMDVTQTTHQALPSLWQKTPDPEFDIAVIDFGNSIKQISPDTEKKLTSFRPDRYKFDFIACAIPIPGIADAFKKAGFKGFLPKPIRRRQLYEMISYVLGKDFSADPLPGQEEKLVTSHLLSENKKHGASILLVEDNRVNQKMTQMMLSKAGYSVDIASDGKEALERYTAHPDTYDLIFMDINMPRMDGFEATKQIRSYEDEQKVSRKIPILALTANVLDDFQKKCVSAGMDDFLTKPIKRDLVFKAILKWSGV